VRSTFSFSAEKRRFGGDYIMLGEDIKVKIIGGSHISKIGIDAPKDVQIKRQAVYEREQSAALINS
jgi:carbon storage regulator CsrA